MPDTKYRKVNFPSSLSGPPHQSHTFMWWWLLYQIPQPNFVSISLFVPREPQAGAGYIPLQGGKRQTEEDARLVELVEKGMNWKYITEEMPGRSEDSRYEHHKHLLKRWSTDRQGCKIVIIHPTLKTRCESPSPKNQHFLGTWWSVYFRWPGCTSVCNFIRYYYIPPSVGSCYWLQMVFKWEYYTIHFILLDEMM